MSRLLLVRPEAERDLAAARDWYEQKQTGLGVRFLEDLAGVMRGLERDPERPRLYYRSFRRVLLRRFPYRVFYQVIGERIVVFRVLHAKQAHERGLAGEPPEG
jgi:toxin ParE1/3/4